jgi:hypothetical protein
MISCHPKEEEMDSSISEIENQGGSPALSATATVAAGGRLQRPGFVLPQCWQPALSGRMDDVKFFR